MILVCKYQELIRFDRKPNRGTCIEMFATVRVFVFLKTLSLIFDNLGERVREEEFNRSVRLGKRDTEGLKRKQKGIGVFKGN